jgi:AraC family transcriptional regulator
MKRHLRHLHSAAIALVEGRSKTLIGAEAAHGLAQLLIETLVECLSKGSAIEVTRATREHQDVAVRFEALLQTQPSGFSALESLVKGWLNSAQGRLWSQRFRYFCRKRIARQFSPRNNPSAFGLCRRGVVEGGPAMQAVPISCPEMNRAARPDPITGGLKLVSEERTRSWRLMSVGVFRRAAGEVVWQSDYYRISCVLTAICGTERSDDGRVEEYRLRPGDIALRPPNRKLWSDLSGGRFIQILQSRETYDNLIPELVRDGTVHFDPQDPFRDPLISQIAVTLANEIDDGFVDGILADALNTALAVQVTRRFVDRSALLLEPSNGRSRERLERVRDYIEAHLDDRLTLADLAGVACLSPYHFSRSFKQAVGVGPQRYVMQRRLERAKTLMRRTNQPLALIAQEAGFAVQSHLTLIFRREMGVTPGRYRAALA